MDCTWSFRVEVSIVLVGAFLVVNANGLFLVAVSSEGWIVLLVVSVVSLAVTLKVVLAVSATKGIGNSVIPAVTL